MNTKIYVGNILYEVTDQDLRDVFSQFGEVMAAEVVRYQKSKRSKGFGFVRMATPEAAQQAIQALNNQDYRGRKLFLDFARSDDPTEEVREKQQQNKPTPEEIPATPTYTPITEQQPPTEDVQVQHEEIPVEEVNPQEQVLPQEQSATPQPQEAHEKAEESATPIRNFGTIFSNSPGKNEETDL